jgi:hypothetical protein
VLDLLGVHERVTLCPAAWIPLALKASRFGEFDASLRKLIFPEELPPFCGAKVTVKETLCPAATVSGNAIPLTEYPSPFQSADVTVTRELPALSVPVLVALSPTATLPKSRLEGDTTS